MNAHWEPPLKPGTCDYLSPAGHKKCCPAFSPFSEFACTREINHTGDHAAHDDNSNQICRWED